MSKLIKPIVHNIFPNEKYVRCFCCLNTIILTTFEHLIINICNYSTLIQYMKTCLEVSEKPPDVLKYYGSLPHERMYSARLTNNER